MVGKYPHHGCIQPVPRGMAPLRIVDGIQRGTVNQINQRFWLWVRALIALHDYYVLVFCRECPNLFPN